MPPTATPAVPLAVHLAGTGEPLVLVHGSWSDHATWSAVAPGLARSFRVLAYDRRNHGGSPRDVAGSRRDHEDDLAALIEGLGGGAAHVVGTSFGGSIAIGLAARRPELVRSLVAHEPPLLSLAGDDPAIRRQLDAVQDTVRAVVAQVRSGRAEEAARAFVEEVALGPGGWELLPPPLRATMVDNARSFVAEQQDPRWADAEPAALADLACPVLLTQGDRSPAWFGPIVARLAGLIGTARVHTFHGAGHAPHLTHPADVLATVTGFAARATGRVPLAA